MSIISLIRIDDASESTYFGNVQMATTDDLAVIQTAGYLSPGNVTGFPINPTDVIEVLYNWTGTTGTYTVQLPTISTSGIITLSSWVPASNFAGPVVSGDFVSWDGTLGETTDLGYVPSNSALTNVVMQDGASIADYIATYNDVNGTLIVNTTTAIQPGNLQAGLSGTAGSLTSFPATSSKGSLSLTAVANTGNYATVISNDAMGEACTISIPDPSNAAAQFVIGATATPFVSGNFPKNSGTAGLMVDSGVSVTSLSGAITQLGQLQQISVTLTAAQVIAAYATPEVLIPAVSGKVAIVHSATVYTASTGNTAFATGVAPIIQYGTTAHGAGTIAVGTGLVTGDITASTSQVRTIGPAASAVYTGVTDEAITFSCTTAYTAGTGTTVTFTLVYELITATV